MKHESPWRRRTVLAAVLPLLLPMLVSCSGPRLRGEFRSYNNAYADSVNEQMLLNLARLDNGHPSYYLVIGDIQNKFKITTSAAASTTGNVTDNTTTTEGYTTPGGVLTLATRSVAGLAGRVFGYNVSGSHLRESTPDFKFIPLNNEAVSRQILSPISTDVFSTLYLQGYPIDQLMRVMIERVETTLLSGEEVVLINSPTRAPVESYVRFLRSCAILRELQIRGELLFDTHAVSGGRATDGEAGEGVSGRRGGAVEGVVAGEAQRGDRPVAAPASVPVFYLRAQRAGELVAELAAMDRFDREAVENLIGLLREGITIKTDISNVGQARTRLVLRSFDRATEAVASEQGPFEALMRQPEFAARVPESEQRPILRMQWEEGAALEPALQTVRYAGKTYQITDPAVTNPLDPAARWNRDVFRLMVALGSQVTVDISKFQRSVIGFRQE